MLKQRKGGRRQQGEKGAGGGGGGGRGELAKGTLQSDVEGVQEQTELQEPQQYCSGLSAQLS